MSDVGSEDPWLTEKEAAAELRVSPSTVRRLRDKIGYAKGSERRVFYPLSLIRAYKQSQVVQPCQTTSSEKSATAYT